MNNIRLNGITIVVELQTFVCVAINLFNCYGNVVDNFVSVVIPVGRASHSHKVCFIAMKKKISTL